MELRILRPGDEAAVDRFLIRHTDSSLFLRSNLRAAGLTDQGQFLQGTWAASFDKGQVTGVAAHFWNGRLILQAPSRGGALGRLACRSSRRALNGLIGPWSQVCAARHALDLDDAPTTLASREDLFSLALASLQVPEALSTGRLVCRRALPANADLLTAWRIEFHVEPVSRERTPEIAEACRESVVEAIKAGGLFLLEEYGHPVSTAAFNGRIPDCVQIGAVWTPPSLRGRGFARSVVAGALLAARSEGVARSVLFTGEDNHAARRAYEALGYRRVGDYGLVAFAGHHWVH